MLQLPQPRYWRGCLRGWMGGASYLAIPVMEAKRDRPGERTYLAAR